MLHSLDINCKQDIATQQAHQSEVKDWKDAEYPTYFHGVQQMDIVGPKYLKVVVVFIFSTSLILKPLCEVYLLNKLAAQLQV